MDWKLKPGGNFATAVHAVDFLRSGRPDHQIVRDCKVVVATLEPHTFADKAQSTDGQFNIKQIDIDLRTCKDRGVCWSLLMRSTVGTASALAHARLLWGH